ncbi:MAG: APH(3') family aminoglycoside O-phosphotransferase, partial [Chloroflexota bacterium]
MNTLRKIPGGLQRWLDDAVIEEIREGMSGTSVFRLERRDQPDRFLKIAGRGSEQDLSAEVSRLLWLRGRLPVPDVLYWAEDDMRQYLVLSGIAGLVLYDESLRDQLPALMRLYASGLRQIHDIPLDACPFDMRLDVKIAQAARRFQAGLVDANNFDTEHEGRTAQSLFRELLATRPNDEDSAFTHGDYCTPNVLVDPDALALNGIIDWGRAGIADRYQDLALAARSIEYNFGAAWAAPFFAAYGLSE